MCSRLPSRDLDLDHDGEYERSRRFLRLRGLGLRLTEENERLLCFLLGDRDRDASERVADRVRLSPGDSELLLNLPESLRVTDLVLLLLLLLLLESHRFRRTGDRLRESDLDRLMDEGRPPRRARGGEGDLDGERESDLVIDRARKLPLPLPPGT